jgi:hypothetical protein
MAARRFPSSKVYGQFEDPFEIRGSLPNMVQGKMSSKTLTPGLQLDRPNDEIGIPENLRIEPRE